MGPQIASKWMKNRRCVADAFWERLRELPGFSRTPFWTTFGDHFRPKIEKRHSKSRPKSDAEKVSEIDAEMLKKNVPKWGPKTKKHT